MNKVFAVILIVVLSGCASTPPPPMYLENGKIGHAFTCQQKQMQICYREASNACGEKGYVIVEDKSTVQHDSRSFAGIYGAGKNTSSTEYRSILLYCKG